MEVNEDESEEPLDIEDCVEEGPPEVVDAEDSFTDELPVSNPLAFPSALSVMMRFETRFL